MMIDLMYFEDSRKNEVDFIKEIKENFPNVELHNAYDDIKGYRQEVCLEDEQTDDYMSFLFGNGWYELSLTLQIDMMSEDKTDQIIKWIELAKKQYPQNFKKS